jgi:hypothetical protein
MSDPTMLIGGGSRRGGRPPRAGEPATKRLVIRITDRERQELQRVASENGQPLATIAREALNEFVADYADRTVFPAGFVRR